MTFSLKSFLTFKGEIGRLEYFIKGIIINVVPAILMSPMFFIPEESPVIFPFLLLAIALVVLMFIATFAIIFQRLNDLKQNHWLILLVFIPVVNFIFGLYLLFTPSKKDVSQTETEKNSFS